MTRIEMMSITRENDYKFTTLTNTWASRGDGSVVKSGALVLRFSESPTHWHWHMSYIRIMMMITLLLLYPTFNRSFEVNWLYSKFNKPKALASRRAGQKKKIFVRLPSPATSALL